MRGARFRSKVFEQHIRAKVGVLRVGGRKSARKPPIRIKRQGALGAKPLDARQRLPADLAAALIGAVVFEPAFLQCYELKLIRDAQHRIKAGLIHQVA